MANDFSGDANCIALYNFESGALITDSKNSNDLTDVNTVGTDTTNFKQGSAASHHTYGDNDHFSLPDADQQSGFPLKAGESNTTFSICGWFRKTDAVFWEGIVSKFVTAGNLRVFLLSVTSVEQLWFSHGYNSGASEETLRAGVADEIAIDVWHHLKVTYDDGAWTLRVWNDNSSTYVIDASGSAVQTISIRTVPWALGAENPPGVTNNWDGQLDEFAFFTDIVSDAEQDQIIAGTYGAVADIVILRRRRDG